MSWPSNELNLEDYISYDAETNIGQCLIPECHTVFIGKRNYAIKRHYRMVHNVYIDGEEEEENDNNEETKNIYNSSIAGEGNPFVSYSIKYLNDKKRNGKNDLNVDANEGGKGYRTFLVADYVDYNKETNVSKCLVRNCERPMSGRRTGNIKRHYHKVHNFVIVHDNQETIQATSKELTEYYNNDYFCDNTRAVEEEDENDEYFGENSERQPINYEQYIDYDPLINKSLCKVPSCKAYLVGKKPYSITRHYGLVHNYDIESNGIKLFDKSKYSKVTNVQTSTTSLIPVDDLVIYDKKSSTYQCLVINCNHVLEKQLAIIKKHYHEKHKIIIARDSDNIPHRFYRKRRPDLQQSYDTEYFKEYQENSNEASGYSIKTELLSDDEQQPHCSKRPNLVNYMSEKESCASKKENNSDDELATPRKYLKERLLNKPTENSKKIEITLTKQHFFKLCLGLLIDRDLPLQLFDDDIYFKPLLKPYEQVFDSPINSHKMEDLMHKAYNIIVSDLKETFTNKIICLELYVLRQEMENYIIFNVRFLGNETVQNNVIGVLDLTERTTILPISDYLRTFNIDGQQVYTITILTGFHENAEIYNICNNLRKHNTNIKNHPIFDIQIILRTFLHKYTNDIKNWQKLTNFNVELNHDTWCNIKELGQHFINISKTDIDLKPELLKAKGFFKALQIVWNFMDKLCGEQYVTGDFYRDWLCCELELKSELNKNNNTYAGKLYEEITVYKNDLLKSNEFLAALYLDVRFNFLHSRLLSDTQKTKGKLYLVTIADKFKKFLLTAESSSQSLPNNDKDQDQDESIDDEYALLNEHINDIMPVKTNICLQDTLTSCVPTKRQPFSLDILKYWHTNRHDLLDVNELTKIAFTCSASQSVLIDLQNSFKICRTDLDKYDKFLLKFHQNIIERKTNLIF